MKRAEPHIEDKLLELAYGEVPPVELEAIHAHLKGCAACAQALDSIQSVRHVMSTLPIEAPSDSGLDSLLAYAEQKARRAASGPAPRHGRWRWWVPALGLGSALVIVGLLSHSPIQMTPHPPTKAPAALPEPPSATPTPPLALAQTGPAGGKEARLDVQAKDERDIKAHGHAARPEVMELQKAGDKQGADASGEFRALTATPASQTAPRLVADDTTRMTNADPVERKSEAVADRLKDAPLEAESRQQEEPASAGAAAKKSEESPLAAANRAIAEERWEAAIASLRVAIEQSRDPAERDRLLDSLCSLQERLGRNCEPLERQYATSPWAVQRASARASQKADQAAPAEAKH